MAGLMMMEPDPEKRRCRVKNAKHRGTKIKRRWIPRGWFLEQGRSQAKEMLQAEPKLPNWEVPMRLSAAREFLADEESGPPLLGWVSLLDQQVMAPLGNLVAPAELGDSSLENLLLLQKVMRMRSPLGQVIQPRVGLLAGPLEHLQAALLLFFLQMPNWEGKCQCSSLRKSSRSHTSRWSIGRYWV
jgi:hypothetical protein